MLHSFLVRQDDPVGLLKARIVGRDHSFPRAEPRQDLHLLTRTAPDLDAPALSSVARGSENKDPVPAGAFQEGPNSEDGPLRIVAKLQAALGSRTLDEGGRASPLEIEIDPEQTVLHLGVDPFDRKRNRFTVDGDGGDLTNPYTRQVELVDIGIQLHPCLRRHLGEALARTSDFAHFKIDRAHLAGNGRTNYKPIELVMHHREVPSKDFELLMN